MLKQSFLFISPCMDAPYVWDHISEGKLLCIKNLKTCGPSKWPPLTTGMSYSCGPSVSIEKPRDKRLAYKLVDSDCLSFFKILAFLCNTSRKKPVPGLFERLSCWHPHSQTSKIWLDWYFPVQQICILLPKSEQHQCQNW